MTASPRAVASAALAELEAGRPVVIATLVERSGPGYLAPGASLLVGTAGPLAGLISGGCVEEEIAARVRDTGPGPVARTIVLDTGADEIDGLGIGCGGRLTVMTEPLRDGPGWRAWLRAVARGRAAARRISASGTVGWRVAASTGAGTWGTAPAARPAAWPFDVRPRLRAVPGGWQEVVPAAPRVSIVGHGPEVEPLTWRLLRLGWRVRVLGPSNRALARLRGDAVDESWLETSVMNAAGLDGRGKAAAPELEPGERVVAASRRLDLDAAALAWGARGGAALLGVVAGRERMRALAARAELADVDIARVEGPVGLDLGAEGPEEIATAVAARLVRHLRRSAAPLWAVVPAAGASRRMGRPKPLLRRDGRTLLERALDAADAACDGALVVVGNDGSEVASSLDGRVATVHAPAWADGLAASLHAGAAALPDLARTLVLLPDMPGVDGAHLARLRGALRSADGAASRYPDGRLGAPAVLPDDLAAGLRGGTAAAGDTGVGGALTGRHDVAAVPLADPTDLDTPEQAARAGWS